MDRILVVDDESGIRTVLRGVLEGAGYQVDTAESGEAALANCDCHDYDLLLVDLQMTGIGGLHVICQARAANPGLATVILTGYATVDTAVAALHEGVDDYLIKPASPQRIRHSVRNALERRRSSREKEHLLARIMSDAQSLLGTVSTPSARTADPAIRQGPLFLDESAHHAAWQGRPLTLTATEFKLLAYLARHAGRVQSPQELVAAVQGYHCSQQEARELIKPHLYRLRAAIEPDPARPRYLTNVRGVGYVLRLDEPT